MANGYYTVNCQPGPDPATHDDYQVSATQTVPGGASDILTQIHIEQMPGKSMPAMIDLFFKNPSDAKFRSVTLWPKDSWNAKPYKLYPTAEWYIRWRAGRGAFASVTATWVA